MNTYKEIEIKLANFEPFRGSSLTGLADEYGTYRVFSYDTLIATAWPTPEGMKGKVTDQWYSVTTSRAQNLIRKAWGI